MLAPGMSIDEMKEVGHVPEAYVIELAHNAGLTLGARSAINANPKDQKDYAAGVWTLPLRKLPDRGGQP